MTYVIIGVLLFSCKQLGPLLFVAVSGKNQFGYPANCKPTYSKAFWFNSGTWDHKERMVSQDLLALTQSPRSLHELLFKKSVKGHKLCWSEEEHRASLLWSEHGPVGPPGAVFGHPASLLTTRRPLPGQSIKSENWLSVVCPAKKWIGLCSYKLSEA